MKHLRKNGEPVVTRPRLWLAAVDGRRLPHPLDEVAPVDEPERMLEVEFVGLSEIEQLRALAAFPGGRRFVLKPRAIDP